MLAPPAPPGPLFARSPDGISASQQPIVSRKKSPREGGGNLIALNKKARHDFFIEETLEAGLALEGWEVKSLRAGRVQIRDAYVLLKDGEAWLFGALITPLPSASTHVQPDPMRSRKLLLHRREIAHLIGAVERRGYTVVPTRLFWKHGRAKLDIGTAKGKRQHDKRTAERDRDWQRQRQRLMKAG
jgi:SsrA-binding protein